MGFLAWIVFGAIAGWVANVVVSAGAGDPYRQRLGCLVSILVGVVGAAVGGLLYKLATGREKTFEFDFPSLGVAALGAIVLLALLRVLQTIGRRPPSHRP